MSWCRHMIMLKIIQKQACLTVAIVHCRAKIRRSTRKTWLSTILISKTTSSLPDQNCPVKVHLWGIVLSFVAGKSCLNFSEMKVFQMSWTDSLFIYWGKSMKSLPLQRAVPLWIGTALAVPSLFLLALFVFLCFAFLFKQNSPRGNLNHVFKQSQQPCYHRSDTFEISPLSLVHTVLSLFETWQNEQSLISILAA